MNTETQKFIEDAIAGGWGSHIGTKWRIAAGFLEHMQTYWGKGVWERVVSIATIIIDPLVWEAVGRTRGWDVEEYPDRVYEAWDVFFHQLYNGKKIEEALKLLSKPNK